MSTPGRTRALDRAGVAQRAARARAFLLIAEASAAAVDSATRAVGTSNAVEAGIAASDAICGKRLGERSDSQQHADAVSLLQRAAPKERTAVNAFRRLIGVKSRAQYGDGEFSPPLASENLERARMLVQLMDQILDER